MASATSAGVRYADQPRHQLDVPAHRPVRHETTLLQHVTDVPSQLDFVDLPDVGIVHGDHPAVRGHQAVEAPEQRGLA
jgi:hypothetical protein